MACRTKNDKRELVRVVRNPSGGVLLDASGCQPGRGAYVCYDQECWQDVRQRGLLSQHLKAAIEADMLESLAGQAERHRMVAARDGRAYASSVT